MLTTEEYLIETAKVPAERLFVVEPTAPAASSRGSRVYFQLK